jgi:hypothetical protein
MTFMTKSLESSNDLFAHYVSIQLPGNARFVGTEDIFREETGIDEFDVQFAESFLGKMEVNVPDASVNLYTLGEDTDNDAIRHRLGDRLETSLWHFFSLLKTLPRGQVACFLSWLICCTNVICYIRGKDGKLWTVHVHLDSLHSFKWGLSCPSGTPA